MEEKLHEYIDLLLKWNNKMNLIGKSTIDNVYDRHIKDSTQLLKFFSQEEIENSIFADFGTGAGVPGIILSICGVKKIYLLEKSPKKCENIFDVKNLKFDIIVSRALAPLDELLKMIYPFCKKDSKCLFLKGKRINEEIVLAQKTFNFDYKLFDSETSDEGKVIIVKKIRKLEKYSI